MRLAFTIYAPLRDALRSTVRDLDLIIISILTTVSYCAFALWLCASPVSVAIVRAVDVTNDARTNASHAVNPIYYFAPRLETPCTLGAASGVRARITTDLRLERFAHSPREILVTNRKP